MVVKTYRGLLADGGQDQIRLSTIKGKVGYRIVKLQIISASPGTDNEEAIVQIFKVPQTAASIEIDFSDQTLLACAFSAASANAYYAGEDNIIFDSEIFNQDIYITYKAQLGSTAFNYYLELEVISLSDESAQYTTIKDLRNAA
jgi:hypothetical protein